MEKTFEKSMEGLQIDKSNWNLTKFGDIAIQQKQKVDRENTSLTRYVKGEHMGSEDLHLRSWGELKDEYLGPAFIRRFDTGDILYGSRRTYLRKVVIAPFSGITSNTTFVIKANEEKVDSRLLPFIMMSEAFTENSIRNSKGSVNPYVNWKDLANYEFLLPPKDQQAQLAKLLWAMDEVVEREKEVLKSLSLLEKVQNKKLVDYAYSSISRPLPLNWSLKRIKQFAKVQSGATPLRSNTAFFENGIIPWIKTLDLNNEKITKSEELITHKALKNTSCKLMPKGTVLVAMYGGFNQIGRTGILEIEAATNQALSSVIIDDKIILPEYLLLVLNTKVSYWRKVAISSRKDPNITKNDVENFPVPIPPLKKQSEILVKSNLLIQTAKKSKIKIQNSTTLQKSLINQIF